MPEKAFKNKLQDVLSRTNEFLNYSISHVVEIHDDVIRGLGDLHSELGRVREEIAELQTAGDAVGEAYRNARKELANAEDHTDYEDQAKKYDEAERFMRLRATFEERERYLRRRRDDLEREKVRMEKIMSSSKDVMGKMYLAEDILRNRLDSMESLKSSEDLLTVSLALRFAERESKKLAREIHDGPIQQFAASLLSFEYLERMADAKDMEAVKTEIVRIKKQLQEALGDFRGFLLQLQPQGLDKGLDKAVKRLAESYEDRYGVDFEVAVPTAEDTLPIVLRSNLFRVVQEAASNALRHGNAKKISVHCSYGDGELSLKIEDDGVGFDVDKVKTKSAERRSFGLSNMEERIRFMNGTFSIDSQPGQGTRIRITVPIEKNS